MKSLYTNLTLLLLLFFTAPAFALDYYWVGGSGMWSDHNNHWATTSGGNAFHDQVPQSMDNVYFDANSFPVPGGTVTIDQTIIYCMDMDWTGATGTPVLSGPGDKEVWIYGSLNLISNMHWNINGYVYFLSFQLGKTIQMAGNKLNSRAYFDGIGGGWTFLDKFSCYYDLFHKSGVINTNDQEVEV
ncbi:MAG: hypothetical protein Q7T20_16135, partial [Saprospiraceae bacterium]|nr:hypothetical protein [Saprospiraceae bacterium]